MSEIISETESLFKIYLDVISQLSSFQKEILTECLKKRNGGLSLPMGTGKTIISLLLGIKLKISQSERSQSESKKKLDNPILIVVSKSLIPNWISEIDKFFDDSISYEILHSEYIKKMDEWTPRSHIVLTTPQLLAKYYKELDIQTFFEYYERPEEFGPEVKYYDVPSNPYLKNTKGPGCLYSIKWSCLIIDEAQCYYNITSKRCLGMSSICSSYRWLLSGTLFEEPRIPKILGYYLLLNYERVPRNLPEFKKFVSDDFYEGVDVTLVKRLKNEDFIEPKVNKEIISHGLYQEELIIYQNSKKVLNNLKEKAKEYKDAKDSENLRKFNSYIMAMITYLKQCLVCPLIPITSVAIDVADYTKKSELSEIFTESINNLNLDKWLNDENSLCSSRIQSLLKVVQKHKEDKVIIFSCYRTVLNVIKYYLPEDRECFTIEGNYKMDKRQRVIKDFASTGSSILLLTYEVGCNGLNLQCANTVLLVDQYWNKGKPDQAIARCLRRGQEKEVNVYYFTSNTGLENSLFKMQKSKVEVAEELSKGAIKSKISKLSRDEIIKMVNTEDNVQILQDIIQVNNNNTSSCILN